MLAGVNGTDPFCSLDAFLDDLRTSASRACRTFPTVGLIDGTFRANLEETGMGYAMEVEMIRLAHEKRICSRRRTYSTRADAISMVDGGRGHHRRAHGPDDQGRDRRRDRAIAR